MFTFFNLVVFVGAGKVLILPSCKPTKAEDLVPVLLVLYDCFVAAGYDTVLTHVITLCTFSHTQ